MLISIIQPQNISFQSILSEVAKAAKTTAENIIKFEYWQNQLWVNISGIGGRILSYRSLPIWLQQIIIAIRSCTSLDQLQKLGDILKQETQRFPQYYSAEDVEKMREIWSEQRSHLRKEEERLKPLREHQQKATEWLETWQKMISHCQSVDSLQYLYPEMERQSKEFADLPDILEELLQTFQQRWQTLSNVDSVC